MAASPRAVPGSATVSALLATLSTVGPTSRSELAKILDVSPATITQITKGLLSRGLITELDQMPSQGGRPARALGLATSAGGALGAKIVSDHVALIDVDLDGTIRSTTEVDYNSKAPDALDKLATILGTAVANRTDPLLGIGIGLPGTIDAQASGIVDAPSLGWSGTQIGPFLRSRLGVPILIDNDVNTLAVAERIYGVGRAHDSYLIVSIGRGIGCGIVIDKEIYRGARGFAGEIGHNPVLDDGPLCTCGNHGCLDAVIGDDSLTTAAQTKGIITATQTKQALNQAALAGNVEAQAIFEIAAWHLGRSLASLVHMVDPEIVVIQGEGTDVWELWKESFEASFRRFLLPTRREIPFVVEPWSDDKWALGAASLVFATPFDTVGNSGDQGDLVRERITHDGPGGNP